MHKIRSWCICVPADFLRCRVDSLQTKGQRTKSLGSLRFIRSTTNTSCCIISSWALLRHVVSHAQASLRTAVRVCFSTEQTSLVSLVVFGSQHVYLRLHVRMMFPNSDTFLYSAECRTDAQQPGVHLKP